MGFRVRVWESGFRAWGCRVVRFRGFSCLQVVGLWGSRVPGFRVSGLWFRAVRPRREVRTQGLVGSGGQLRRCCLEDKYETSS